MKEEKKKLVMMPTSDNDDRSAKEGRSDFSLARPRPRPRPRSSSTGSSGSGSLNASASASASASDSLDQRVPAPPRPRALKMPFWLQLLALGWGRSPIFSVVPIEMTPSRDLSTCSSQRLETAPRRHHSRPAMQVNGHSGPQQRLATFLLPPTSGASPSGSVRRPFARSSPRLITNTRSGAMPVLNPNCPKQETIVQFVHPSFSCSGVMGGACPVGGTVDLQL